MCDGAPGAAGCGWVIVVLGLLFLIGVAFAVAGYVALFRAVGLGW